MLTETVVGALGKFLLFQLENCGEFAEQILDKYLESMPLKYEEEEAQASNKLFLNQILAKNQVLMAGAEKNSTRFMKILEEMKTLLQTKTDITILDSEGVTLLEQVMSMV